MVVVLNSLFGVFEISIFIMHIIIAVKYSKIKNKSKAAYICLIVGFFVNIVGILGLFMTLDDLKKKMAQNDKKQNIVATKIL